MQSTSQGLGLYLRISKDDGTTMAVERQEAECRRKAAALGYTVTKVYTDQGKSASNKRIIRPAYNELLADARAGRIGGVLTWSHDRLTRQPDQLGAWLDLADRGCKLVTVGGELDLSDDAGRFAARIFAAMAEQEVRRKAARQVSANRQRAERGLPYAKVRAFGYETGGMEPHPTEAPLIQEAVAGLLAGTHTIHGICNDWNRRGIKTTRGKMWSRTSLRRVLTSPRNAGLLAYQDGAEVYPAQWPAIVSEEDVKALTTLLQEPGRNSNTGDGKVKNLLTHLMHCAECQREERANEIGAITQARGVRAYRCTTCFISIDRGHADTFMIENVSKRLAEGYGLPGSAVTVREKRAELAKVSETADGLAQMFAAGEISLDQFRLMNEGPSNARKALEAEITDLVQRDAITALVDGLRRSGTFGNTVGNIRANAETIRERFEVMDIHQQRTVIRGLFPVILLHRAASGGRQSVEAIRRRIEIVEDEQ